MCQNSSAKDDIDESNGIMVYEGVCGVSDKRGGDQCGGLSDFR